MQLHGNTDNKQWVAFLVQQSFGDAICQETVDRRLLIDYISPSIGDTNDIDLVSYPTFGFRFKITSSSCLFYRLSHISASFQRRDLDILMLKISVRHHRVIESKIRGFRGEARVMEEVARHFKSVMIFYRKKTFRVNDLMTTLTTR